MMARSEVLVQELVKGRIFCWSRIICVLLNIEIFSRNICPGMLLKVNAWDQKFYLNGLLSIKSRSTLSHGLAISCDKLKPLHLQDRSACGFQTRQDGYLPWAAPTHKVTGPLNDVILLDHDTTIPMATKLGKVVIYSKLDDPSISWFCDVTWQIKYFISPLHQTSGNQTWQRGNSPWGPSTNKATFYVRSKPLNV